MSTIRCSSWLIYCLIMLYQLPNFISCQCRNDTYFSHDLDGCVECPDVPLIDCRTVHHSDISSCLQSCTTGNYMWPLLTEILLVDHYNVLSTPVTLNIHMIGLRLLVRKRIFISIIKGKNYILT